MTTSTKKDTPLLPVYLAVGEDTLKRRAVANRLRARLSKITDLSFNSDTFNGELSSGEDIVAACNTLPFASSVRLVEVELVDKLKKTDAETLIAYVSDPNDTTVLFLVAEKLAKNTRLYKAIAKRGQQSVIDCTPPKSYELPKKVRSMATSHKITITEAAAKRLIDFIGEDTVHLDSELRKLALSHRGNDAVTEHEIIDMVSCSAEIKPWEFVDAFSARSTHKCLSYLNRMNSVSPHALIAMCTTRLRELVCAKSLLQRGNPHALASVLKLQDWRVKNHIAWAKGFTPEELRLAFISSRNAEEEMKSGRDPDEVFMLWMLSILRKT